jgi:hypothetical protein
MGRGIIAAFLEQTCEVANTITTLFGVILEAEQEREISLLQHSSHISCNTTPHPVVQGDLKVPKRNTRVISCYTEQNTQQLRKRGMTPYERYDVDRSNGTGRIAWGGGSVLRVSSF